jgi:hypothetical protein
MNEIEEIRNRIYEIRGRQVMFDKDLAELYGVEVKNLNKAVSRNLERFPDDFMFQLTKEEYDFLRFQNGTIKKGRGEHSKYLPYVFTEQGVAMLSGVLRSPTAVQVNIRIMRTFVAVRQYLAAPKCGNCQLEGEVKRLAAYIEEILADQNEINEDTRNAIAVLQAAVFSDEPKCEDSNKRVFSMQVKGFEKED